ncbi:1942_t:CDS:2, partial [Ambispora leptoticha]
NDINLRKNSRTGKVSNNILSFEIVMKVITFIGNFAKQNGLPSPGRNFRDNTYAIIYLPADITYSSLYIQYTEATENNNQHQIDMRFNANYWLVEEKETKVLEWHKYIKCAYKERENYKQQIKLAYENIQNFEINNLVRAGKPNSLNITDKVYFKSLYKVHLFGICDDAFSRQINYLIKENELVGKGADTVISLVHNWGKDPNYFELHGLGEKNLVIHTDNYSEQNKNNAMIAYLTWRVLTGLHDSITYCFMVAEHTKFSPDGFFGLIKLLLRKSEVDNLDDLVKVVQNSTPGRYNIAQTVFDNKKNQILNPGKVKISTSSYGEKTLVQIEKTMKNDNLIDDSP